MTPDEARQIDRAEFTADCIRIRDRAFGVIADHHGADHAHTLRWSKGSTSSAVSPVRRRSQTQAAPTKPKKTWVRGTTARVYAVNGQSQTMKQWAAVIGVGVSGLSARIRVHGSLEAALAVGSHQRPGVAKNLAASSGTGGGSTTQDLSEIEILE